MNYEEKIRALIATGEAMNIELAFELAKSVDLDMDEVLVDYRLLLNMEADVRSLSAEILLDALLSLYMDLMGRKLKKLPEAICSFKHLRSLTLTDNELDDLAPCLAQLPLLSAINLRNNKFRKIPDFIFDMQQLTLLSFSGNALNEVPEAIGKMQTLDVLSFGACHLQTIPKSLFSLKNLKNLDLGENRLSELPEELGNLEKLEIFHLDHNRLQSLPDSIGNCSALRELDLSYSPFLEALPASFASLTNLSIIKIAKCPRLLLGDLPERMPWTEFYV